MSLADELLADLEGGGDEGEEEMDDDADAGANDDNEIEEVTEEATEEIDTSNYDRVRSVARLTENAHFKEMIGKIEEGIGQPCDQDLAMSDPEYTLVVEVNKLAVEIDNEINVIHKFVRDKYGKRFPELESLVPTPIEFMNCVRELGNEILTKGQNREALGRMLQPATVIVVSVTASTTQGVALTDDELAAVFEACDMAAQLQQAKLNIFNFVEQRMSYIAPNLSALIGAGPSAMLMGHAGGLSQLSKMPACNVLVLGAQRRTLTGFSSTAVLPHTGYIYYTPVVQSLPPDQRRRAARAVSGKVALAARVDASHSCRDGAIGQKFADDIRSKFQKWLEPPPPKAIKPLPKPIDATSKKRGGRRLRKLKERLGMTELRKKANRVTFAQIEEDIEQVGSGFTRGQLKAAGGVSGTIRSPQVDQKSRARMSKLLQNRVHKANQFGTHTSHSGVLSARSSGGSQAGGTGTVRSTVTSSGTASSVSFTPVQGLEIVNPQANAAAKVSDANNKYFGTSSAFMKVAGQAAADRAKAKKS